MKLEIEKGRRPGYATITLLAGVIVSVVYALLRLYNVIPSLPCYWRELFGMRCAGCGTTTTLQHLLTANPAMAFEINPLIAFAYILATAVIVNGLVGMVAGRRLIIRLSRVESWVGVGLILVALVANWFYVYNR